MKILVLISIHSLRMEGDQYLQAYCGAIRHFNPLPPHGGRPTEGKIMKILVLISIHSLRMEGDML